ncbi:redoxin domain-containing protein [Pedobacter sp. MC2016-14]|uniref:TlpA disulfide reductase family protein n=1 Tax=Pedobacter sp. MC2016-14 TaxID=2897327 RepID=UPI001E57E6D8|nr:TlpA disulfide reductase family protein [Pedobacter sp. MC2016-14]MCD0490390.1 redoxin domain-containing protein [Pedobacter sp. MC2016-14]
MNKLKNIFLSAFLLVFTATAGLAQDTTRLADYKKMMSQQDMSKMRILGEAFISTHPESSTNVAFDIKNRISYAHVYSVTVVLNVMEKNYDIIKKYIHELPYGSMASIYYKTIQIPHDRKDMKDQELYPYADLLMKRLESFRNHPPKDVLDIPLNEWKEQFNLSIAKNFLPTHIGILYNVGKKDEALQYAVLAQQYLQYKKASVNGVQAMVLNEKGKTADLKNLLIKSIYENQSTPEMLDMLKQAYVKEKKTEIGFPAYLESLKNSENQHKQAKEVIGKLLNKDVPEFSMQDGNGKLVKSKDLLGKIVVLDFWATWCVPCKASFPGMKLAMDKYKNDSSVIFYFVDTEERGNTYKEEVLAYLKKNNFPFQVLFDNPVPGEKATGEVFNSMCKAFTISGIPQKLVIDPKGKLRFISVGYHGSPTALADEISTMVDYIKSNQ